MKAIRRLANETFVIGWSEALLVFVAGAGLGTVITVVVTLLIA